MTCIVGLVHKQKVYLGGDSAAVTDRHYLTDAGAPKIFRNGEFIIGYTSSFRMGQLLEHKFVPPAIEGEDLHKYMITRFVEEVRQSFLGSGVIIHKNGEETMGTFLVGIRGELFEFEDDFAVLKCNEFAAVGCGVSVALGSLYSTRGQKPQKRIVTALEAASTFTTGVRAPFHILKD